MIMLSETESIQELLYYDGNIGDYYDSMLITLYVICIASLHWYNDFMKYRANNKFQFPMTCLYNYICILWWKYVWFIYWELLWYYPKCLYLSCATLKCEMIDFFYKLNIDIDEKCAHYILN